MKIRHIEIFFVVADECHFSRAADRLSVTQSSVSQTISGLEEHLGVELFDRSHRQVRLTGAGEIFLEESSRGLYYLNRAETLAQRAAAGEFGRLKIALSPMAALTELPDIIAGFRDDEPEVHLELVELGADAQISALKGDDVDLGFQPSPAEGDDISTETIIEGDYVAVLPVGHELTAGEEVAFEDLAAEPFIKYGPVWPRDLAESEPQVVARVDHAQTMLALVAAGYGVAVVPSDVGTLQPDGVMFRIVEPRTAWTLDAVSQGGCKASSVTRFLRHLREHLGLPEPEEPPIEEPDSADEGSE